MRCFKFLWFIENYSYSWRDKDEGTTSPHFLVEIMHSTTWYLLLYPRGDDDSNFIDFDLCRWKHCDGPESIALQCELSILDANGRVSKSAEIEKGDNEFGKGTEYGFYDIFDRLAYRQGEKGGDSASDILRVCLKIWTGEGKIEKEDFSFARTRIALEKVSFIYIIENFSTLQPNDKKTFDVTSVSKEGLEFSGNIFIKRQHILEDEVMVEILPDSYTGHLITCQIFLLSSSGKELECINIDTRNYTNRIHTFIFPINSRKNLLDKKLEYLPDDNLTLRCKCTLSTGIEFERIEETFNDLHLTPFLREEFFGSNLASSTAESKNVGDDLKSLYKDRILSDVQLKTINKTFCAHKVILCARSPVFRAMLTTDMREKMLNYIEVDDLDDNTIDRFLFFLYTDVLEDLHWESAMKLYYAADKYQVQRLKDMCSSFLTDKLELCNFIDLLILADRHQDSSLMSVVENYICKIKKQIFFTNEWEDFMEKNPQLALKTLHLYLKNITD